MAAGLSLQEVQNMFEEGLIFIDPPADNRDALLNLMGSLMQEKGYAEAAFTQAVIKREEGYPTGLSTGCFNFAVPHTDACHVIKQAVAVAKLGRPVPFAAMGMEEGTVEAEYVFLLLLRNDGAQVALLQKLMNMCSDEAVTARLKKAQTPREVYGIIREYYRETPPEA